MSTPHKHAKFIKAMADGDSVDVRTVDSNDQSWARLLYFYPFDHTGIEFRLTPHRWQAEIDAQKAGKKIQFLIGGCSSWIDATYALNFDAPSVKYRIKPEVLRYRNFKFLSVIGPRIGHVQSEAEAMEIAKCEDFRSWLGDWQEVEA